MMAFCTFLDQVTLNRLITVHNLNMLCKRPYDEILNSFRLGEFKQADKGPLSQYVW